MKKLKNKLNNTMIQVKCKAAEFLSNERGDTNFISIAIILIVIIGIAIAFIQFGNDIMDKFKQAVGDLMGNL